MQTKVNKRKIGLAWIVSVTGLLLGTATISHAAPQSTDAEITQMVKTALAPYREARAWKGTRTVTTIIGGDSSELTTTSTIEARCDEKGNVARLRARTISWGHRGSEDVTGQGDALFTYDGDSAWLYRSGQAAYRRVTFHPTDMPTLLGLPPDGLHWTMQKRRSDDLPSERVLRAHANDADWTLVLDASTDRLLRVETLHGQGAQKTQTTIAIRDQAFNIGTMLPDRLFAFVAPAGAREEATQLTEAAESTVF